MRPQTVAAFYASLLLGIYSHMINYPLYLFNYPIGHLIAFQIEEHVKKTGRLGPEFERMCRQGALSPDRWMEGATGAPVSAVHSLNTAPALNDGGWKAPANSVLFGTPAAWSRRSATGSRSSSCSRSVVMVVLLGSRPSSR